MSEAAINAKIEELKKGLDSKLDDLKTAVNQMGSQLALSQQKSESDLVLVGHLTCSWP